MSKDTPQVSAGDLGRHFLGHAAGAASERIQEHRPGETTHSLVATAAVDGVQRVGKQHGPHLAAHAGRFAEDAARARNRKRKRFGLSPLRFVDYLKAKAVGAFVKGAVADATHGQGADEMRKQLLSVADLGRAPHAGRIPRKDMRVVHRKDPASVGPNLGSHVADFLRGDATDQQVAAGKARTAQARTRLAAARQQIPGRKAHWWSRG